MLEGIARAEASSLAGPYPARLMKAFGNQSVRPSRDAAAAGAEGSMYAMPQGP
jgi:hypothetical protein